MPRIARQNQIAEDMTYHIYNRGNGKLDIFHDISDFEHFISIVQKYKQRYKLYIYHWALLNNHFHFIMTIDIPEKLSKCIGGILQTYAQYHHRRWNSAGRLWQGRFISQPVQKEKYLFECGRYIERNPMRAGIVQYPWDYRWSSCKVYIKGIEDSITTPDPYLTSFGDNKEERVERYKEWLMEGEVSDFDNMNRPVGDKAFVSQLSLKDGRLVTRRKGRPSKKKIVTSKIYP